LEDNLGNLWLGTNKGLCRFSLSTGKIKIYTPVEGLQDYEFNTGACYQGRSGEMFFGGVNGFNCFYPDRIEDNPFIPSIVITGFKIRNKPVNIGKDSPLKKHITETREIILSYKDSFFSFEFAALDYTAPDKNRYQYKVERFNEDWIDLGHKHDITLTNLDPGEYILRVRGANNDGIWNYKGTSVRIIITPPLWETWWFRTLVVLFLAALFYIWHHRRMKNLSLKLKTEAEMERLFTKYKVSGREQEIIRLILKGKTNKDIEDDLFISIKTVKSHIYNIYQKLGVKNRLELIHLIQRSANR
jgi:DNA-binding CsgD family transcriptional regulator